MHFLGHSCVRIEIGGRVVLTDPVLTARVGPLVRVVPLPDRATWADADLVLISHQHGDHLHLPSLRLLRHARIVVPRGAGAWLHRKGFPRVEELGVGERLVDGDLTVTAVHAEHSGHRWGPRLTHGPHAPAIGHVLEAEKRIYVAGDTDIYDGMADLGPVDIALLPVWGWGMTLGPGHLDPLGAAAAVELIKPGVAVPVHWGTLALPGVARTARMRRLLSEPAHDFAAAVSTNTEVVVAPPGSEVMHEPGA
ncbi:MBL fold metallo-hydrolase [Kibdelosporangium phytohabitans]|uniref:Zn-dependent hydrolase n=1 Tax=Kibdelosporangium phytohabitans TaxID=860235 RepID=A0A0N7F5F5_9PSEU|nr:MBL fold metallo-hydrolase [Kibdelosporangium phytohabitans]ALG14087.1 Zn-dependent hydrolase [Kibdelosporangium phytohabitans]MBE1466936.1 L-ascorbate metabolism protein UlaG (beta-lactamase superfamily) [Kibdelosporangium phytohabitans]